MHRSSLISILLASCLLLAGCTGTIGPGASGTDAPETPTATPTASSTTTPESTPELAVTPGEIDVEAIAERHASALRDAKSYTVETSVSVEGSNESNVSSGFSSALSLSETVRVDHETGRGLAIIGSKGGNGSVSIVYTDFERAKSYQRIGTEASASYIGYESVHSVFQGETAVGTDSTATADAFENWLQGINFSVAGVETSDGQQLTRLEATGVESHNESSMWNSPGSEPVRTTVLVDEEGMIREISHEQRRNVSGQTVQTTMTITYSNVGSTNVEEPDWLDEARESANETRTATEST